MTAPAFSDALVFFGITGDLAYKKVFPALQTMIRPPPQAWCSARSKSDLPELPP